MLDRKPWLSATQVSMFLKCPRQWAFRYVEHLKRPPSGAMKQSGVFHTTAERNYRQKVDTRTDLPLDEMTDFYAQTFEDEFQREEVVLDEGDTTAALKKQGVDIVKEHCKSVAPTIQPVQVERKITVSLGKDDFAYDLMGIIDLEDDQGNIRDNKAMARTPNQDDLDRDIQLSTYSLIRRVDTKQVEKALKIDAIVKTKVPKAVTLSTTRTREHLRLHLNTIGHVAKAIRAEAFPRNPTGWWCSKKFCGYWDICMGKGIPVHVDMAPNLEQQLTDSIAKVEKADAL